MRQDQTYENLLERTVEHLGALVDFDRECLASLKQAILGNINDAIIRGIQDVDLILGVAVFRARKAKEEAGVAPAKVEIDLILQESALCVFNYLRGAHGSVSVLSAQALEDRIAIVDSQWDRLALKPLRYVPITE